MKKCLAIVGMCGAGKTEVVNYLMERLSAPKVYFGEATFDRMKEDGLELNYENERATRELIRTELGMGAYALLAVPKIKTLLETNDIVIAESLYSWDEYKIMKEEFGDSFLTVAVFAGPQTRFARLSSRDNERPIKELSEFVKRDYTEIEGTDKGGPIARADYMIINEGSIDDLHQQLGKIISALKSKS
jgi:dephospho-CoA kinase